MKNKYHQLAFLSVAVLAVLTFFLVSNSTAQDPSPFNETTVFEEYTGKDGHPKMEYALYKTVRIHLAGELPTPCPLVQKHEEDSLVGDIVRVIVEAPSSALSQTERIEATVKTQTLIETLGGEVESIRKNRVQCRLSLNTLLQLADSPSVKYIRFPLREYSMETSEGVAATGADSWQSMTAYRGNGAKVGVLDLGFKGYTNLLGTDLPDTVKAQSFRNNGDINAGTVHGTACAEIVHDMAPGASLYLANYSTLNNKEEAVDWLLDQGVDVITCSTGGYNTGAGDGTGPYCEIVNTSYDAGVPYVNSAGNAARSHWQGNWNDPNSNKKHNFSNTSEICDFWVPSYTYVALSLKWYDWGSWDGSNYSGSDQDFELYLYYWTGSYWMYVARSTGFQNGSQWPVEFIGYWYSTQSSYWGAQIRKYNANKNVKFDLFFQGNSNSIEHPVAAGSLVVPSDSEKAIAAGANDYTNPYLIHNYSSRGPNLAGITKPDIAAPSGVTTSSYGNTNFFGTSASAPHVGGAIALLVGKTPYTPLDVWTILKGRAADLGTNGKDNVYGHGRLKLDK
jgi:hypothetical protein